MATHLEFMKAIVTKPIYVLKKDLESVKSGRRGSTIVTGLTDTYITDIIEESKIIDVDSYTKVTMHRIFVHSFDSGSYADVGWIINDDIHNCMICRTAFGFFTYKHHCKACGNIVCQSCSSTNEYIFELQDVGPLRVCKLCYFGQELVYCAPNKPKAAPTQQFIKAPTPKPVQPVQPPQPPQPVETEEEKQRKYKAAQQAAFQKEALARIQTGQSFTMNNSQSTSPNFVAVHSSSSSSLSPSPSIQNTREVLPLPPSDSVVGSPQAIGKTRSSDSMSAAPTTIPPVSPTITQTPTSPNTVLSQDATQRHNQLSTYGPMSNSIPTPGFVIKTKRNNGTKIFINLCSHQIIPFKAEVRSTIDVHKTIFMLVSLPLEYQNEKDLSYCIIYDIVVNPDEIYMTNIDSSGAARHRICTQALELIASSYYENLDPSYVILRLASNYKGKDDSGKSTVRSIIIPSPEAFFSFKQIACGAPSAESAPLTASTSSRKGSTTVTSEANSVKSAPNAAPSSSLNGSTRSSTAPTTVPSATSTAILTNLTAQWASNSTIYQLLLTHGESKNLTIDKTIKAMVVPRENLEKFDNRSFNIVLDLMSSHEVNLRDLFVFPETGFVILAEKLKPIVPLYINVCHHPLIGQILYSAGSNNFTYGGKRSVSNDNGSISLNDPIPSPCPYILGKVTERVLDPSSGQSVMSVDVVIPSNVMANAIADSTGELRDRLAIEILKRLASLHVPLSTQFSLPMIQGGYFPVNINLPPKGVPLLEPIINLTEEQKLEFSIVYLGKFFKQGHRYKTWKERLFCLHDTKLLYYDLKMTYTGELSVDELFYQNIANPNEINAPKTSYCFQLVNMNTNNNEYMNCYVFNENIRSLFSMFIGLKNSYLMSFKVIINIPKVKSGWIKKQGHVIKNWKLRYFILNYGLLTYYEKEQPDGLFTQETQTSFQLTTSTSSKDNSHSGPGIGGVKSSIMSSLDTAKGQVELKNATVTVALNDEHNKPLNLAVDHRIQVLDRNGYKLFLAFDSSDEKKAWFEAIKKHIDYANEYLE